MPFPVLAVGGAGAAVFVRVAVQRAAVRVAAKAALARGGEVDRSSREITRVAGWGAAGVSGSAARVGLTVDTVRFERGLERKPRAVRRAAQIAAVRGANAAGRWGATRIRRSLSQLLNVPQKTIRQGEFIRRASYRGGKFTPFHARWKLRHYPVYQLRGVRFRPEKGQGRDSARQMGVLRFRAYGKQVSLDRVMRTRGPRGARYVRLRSSPKGRRFYDRFRAVSGTYLKGGYREPKGLKGQVRERMRREFIRQYRLQRQKDRAAGRP